MKLNPDCVRDILLHVEEVTDSSTEFYYPDDKLLEKYTDNEIRYHLDQCD